MTALSSLGVEDLAFEKYYTICPKCGPDRKKAGARSLFVYKKPPAAYMKCFHASQCEWNTTVKVEIDANTTVIKTEEISDILIPVPEDVVEIDLPDLQSYTYRDIHGNLQFKLFRIPKEDGGKFFLPFSYSASKGWINKAPKDIKVLYNAHLLTKFPGAKVVVAEGEKAADAVAEKLPGFIGVTWPGGANAHHKGDFDLLAGREVYLWPDDDDVGRDAMGKISQLLPVNHHVVSTKGENDGEDIADLTPEEARDRLDVATFVGPKITGMVDKGDFFKKLREGEPVTKLPCPGLDKFWFPRQGIIVLTARSSHGKSSFLAYLAMRYLKHTDKVVSYYTYEMTGQQTIYKMVMSEFKKFLSSDLRKHHEQLDKLCDEGSVEAFNIIKDTYGTRLLFSNSPVTIEEICRDLSNPRLKGSVVFIDHIQKIKPSSGKASDGFLHIKHCMESLETAALQNNLLIITPSQLTAAFGKADKPLYDMPREGKDIEFTADSVLRLWSKTKGEADGVTWGAETKGNFFIHVKKIRASEVNNFIPYNFTGGAIFTPLNTPTNTQIETNSTEEMF